jgi:hypothetical protein
MATLYESDSQVVPHALGTNFSCIGCSVARFIFNPFISLSLSLSHFLSSLTLSLTSHTQYTHTLSLTPLPTSLFFNYEWSTVLFLPIHFLASSFLASYYLHTQIKYSRRTKACRQQDVAVSPSLSHSRSHAFSPSLYAHMYMAAFDPRDIFDRVPQFHKYTNTHRHAQTHRHTYIETRRYTDTLT